MAAIRFESTAAVPVSALQVPFVAQQMHVREAVATVPELRAFCAARTTPHHTHPPHAVGMERDPGIHMHPLFRKHGTHSAFRRGND